MTSTNSFDTCNGFISIYRIGLFILELSARPALITKCASLYCYSRDRRIVVSEGTRRKLIREKHNKIKNKKYIKKKFTLCKLQNT